MQLYFCIHSFWNGRFLRYKAGLAYVFFGHFMYGSYEAVFDNSPIIIYSTQPSINFSIFMNTPSSGNDSRYIGSLYVSIKPQTGSALQSFALSLDDYDDLDNSSNGVVILRGLTEVEAQAFFDRVCQMLETGAPLDNVRSMIFDHADELNEAVVRAQEVIEQETALMVETNRALLKASRFYGHETVNGVEMSVAWYEGLGSQYEIYFPQKEETVVIGQDRSAAEKVFNYAKVAATTASDVDALYDKVEAFVRNDFREAVVLPPKTLPLVVPRLQPTTLEETVNGMRIALESSGEASGYYISLPDIRVSSPTLRNKVNPGDGRFHIKPSRNPSADFEAAKMLAKASRNLEDLFVQLWHKFN